MTIEQILRDKYLEKIVKIIPNWNKSIFILGKVEEIWIHTSFSNDQSFRFKFNKKSIIDNNQLTTGNSYYFAIDDEIYLEDE